MPDKTPTPLPPYIQSLADGVGGRRGEILTAALAVFSEKGYEGGSMRDIASIVGVTEPALYRHFASKEDLFIALIVEVGGQIRDQAFLLLDHIDASDIHANVIAALSEKRQLFQQFAPGFTTILASVVHHEMLLEQYRATVVMPLREKLTETVTRLDAQFGVTDAEADRATRVRALMSLLMGTFVTSMIAGDQPDGAAADAVMRVLRWDAHGSRQAG